MKGYDIEHSIFTFRFCLDNLVSVINRASLYLPSSVTCPDWFKNDYKSFLKYYNLKSAEGGGSGSDSLSPYFRMFYQSHKETIFDSFDMEKLDYKCFLEAESTTADPPVEIEGVVADAVADSVTSPSTEAQSSTDTLYLINFDEEKLPLSHISQELKRKFSKTEGKKKGPLRYHPLQFTFYLTFCVYNSLSDEDEGDKLWDYLTAMSEKLDEIFDNKGPSSDCSVVVRDPSTPFGGSNPLTALLSGGGAGLPPQLQGLMGIISSLGFNMNGSEQALQSLNNIFEKMSSSIAVDPSRITGSDGNIDINSICNNVSEVLADPSIQSEFNNILSSGKQLFETNSEVVQNPAFQNNIKNIAETFLGPQKR